MCMTQFCFYDVAYVRVFAYLKILSSVSEDEILFHQNGFLMGWEKKSDLADDEEHVLNTGTVGQGQ
jgi:hypothetical protein